MRRAIGFAFLLLLGCATSNPSTETRQDVVAEEAAIRSLDEQERTAVLNRDASALERLWADSFTVNAPSGQVASGKSQVMALLRQGLIHYSTFDRQVEAVRIDGDVAIVMGAETVQPIGEAPLAGQTVRRRFTNIWKEDGGTWRLIARHANVVPLR